MLKPKVVKLGFAVLLLAGLIASRPGTATAGACCSTCDTTFNSCLAKCGGDLTCNRGCVFHVDLCDRSCTPGC
jgi:hypothetical protein